MTSNTRQLGALGESAAVKFLKQSGHTILARNYVCPVGELDIISFHHGCIVFVEVKTLSDDAAGDPEEHITPAKQRQLHRVARQWLAARRQPDCAYRFDAISVVVPPQGEPRVRHIVEAFIPE
jgi:putative endonuclease